MFIFVNRWGLRRNVEVWYVFVYVLYLGVKIGNWYLGFISIWIECVIMVCIKWEKGLYGCISYMNRWDF